MMMEIEHKFLITNDNWRASADQGTRYRQAYITTASPTTVRVRIAGDVGYLTIKGKCSGELGITRPEFEYEIPLADAEYMIAKVVDSQLIDKHRYIVEHAGKIWEVDVFSGDNEGLVVAEIELTSENEKFAIPTWVGECVSGQKCYSNSNLAKFPFKSW